MKTSDVQPIEATEGQTTALREAMDAGVSVGIKSLRQILNKSLRCLKHSAV